VFFDTCVYHQPGIDLLLEVIPIDNILFGSEMVGAVRGIDPRDGHYYDDTKRYIDALGLERADPPQDVRDQCAAGLSAAWPVGSPRRAPAGSKGNNGCWISIAIIPRRRNRGLRAAAWRG
jgi:hypothetical protein